MKKIIAYLQERRLTYDDQHHLFLNHPVIIESLFNRPSISVSSIADIIKLTPSPNRLVRATPSQIIELQTLLFTMRESIRLYIDNWKPVYKLPKIQEFNRFHQQIETILDTLEKKHLVAYTTHFTFHIMGKDSVRLHKRAEINMDYGFEFDFFGCTFHHSKLDLFVIQLDEAVVSLDHNISHATMQHHLTQMGVHYLRLTPTSNFTKEITHFISQLRKSTAHQLIGIQPDQRLRLRRKSLPEITQFSHDYNRNHLIYQALPTTKREFDPFDDKYIQRLQTLEMRQDAITIPSESGLAVDDDFIQRIVEEKSELYGENDKMMFRDHRVDLMMIELVGRQEGEGKQEEDLDISSIISTESSDDFVDEDCGSDFDGCLESDVMSIVYETPTKKSKLDPLLKNHQPLQADLSAYQRLSKLKGYQRVTNMEMLTKSETYVKYIAIDDVGTTTNTTNLRLHVKGGIFMGLGWWNRGEFEAVESRQKGEPTHMMLMFSPDQSTGYKTHPVFIRLKKYFFFYKKF